MSEGSIQLRSAELKLHEKKEEPFSDVLRPASTHQSLHTRYSDLDLFVVADTLKKCGHTPSANFIAIAIVYSTLLTNCIRHTWYKKYQTGLECV